PDNPIGEVILPGASTNNCDSIVEVTLNYLQPLSIELVDIQGSCTDTEFTLLFNYNGDTDLTLTLTNTTLGSYILPAGTSSLIVTPTGESIELLAANGPDGTCEVSANGVVNLPQAPSISIVTISGDSLHAISCAGGQDGRIRAELSGPNITGYSFNWNVGVSGAELNGVGAGPYTVTAQNTEGCEVSASITLTEPAPIVLATSTFGADCIGNAAIAQLDLVSGGTAPYLFRLDQGPFVPIDTFPVAQEHAPGLAFVEVQDINGCTERVEVQLAPAPEGDAIINPTDPAIQLGDSIRLSAQTNLFPAIVRWSHLIDTSQQQPLSVFVGPTENTIYSVIIVDEEGCSATAEVVVRVNREVPVYIPSAFSPNGDGNNDIFTFFGRQGIINYSDFRIYNRWGEVMHEVAGDLEPEDSSWAWDGKHRGEPMNAGVYIYIAKVHLADGREEVLSGEIVLLR
ncbi:MAG: gliding motility-associated C-terminal domain-containing protein, partial [Bacteroidota bacterium]